MVTGQGTLAKLRTMHSPYVIIGTGHTVEVLHPDTAGDSFSTYRNPVSICRGPASHGKGQLELCSSLGGLASSGGGL